MLFRQLWIGTVLMAVSLAPLWAQDTLRYRVKVDDPGTRRYQVTMEAVARGDTTLVSLPAWTPGHYTVENYARFVQRFRAEDEEGRSLRWDKLDKDTWRIETNGASRVRLTFEYLAEEVELSMSLLRDDFGFFNGTNLFLFPATGYDFPAEVRFELPEGWRVATELHEKSGVYHARDYHELVDNPTFLGHFAMDSIRVDGRWIRLAVYPERHLTEQAKEAALRGLGRIAETIHGLFGGPPYERYTTFVYLDDQGIMFVAGLEHANSQLDIMPALLFRQPRFSFRPYLYGLLAHEYYHAWNVKRIRPTGLWPYEYDREQFTPLLWVSEGITDYYAHVVLVRSELWNENEFWAEVRGWVASVEAEPAHEAVEDASLNTWIEPTFINQYYYYDKGALLGLLLDIRIRHATDNRSSLDDVMGRLYRKHYREGRGFSTRDFMGYVAEVIGEEAARSFYRDYIDGRQPLPYRETLALAGISFQTDTIIEPFLGVQVTPDRNGRMVVRQVVPASIADGVGLRPGDELLRVGAVEVDGQEWADEFRRLYGDIIGTTINVIFKRGGDEIVRETRVGSRTRYAYLLEPAPGAPEQTVAIREGILGGSP